MKPSFLLIILALLLHSCASVINPRNQRVTIKKNPKTEVLVNNEDPTIKKGKYLIRRDGYPKQITFKRDGYLPENYVMMQYKTSPYYIMSWIPFGIILLLPPLYDQGIKKWDYDYELSDGNDWVKKVPTKEEDDKEIQINKISIELNKEDYQYRHFYNFRNYKKKKSSKETEQIDTEEDINVENTIFSDALNEILKEEGYIDTSRKVLKNSYSNNLLIEAKVKEFVLHHVGNNSPVLNGGFYYVDLTVEWTALDYYKRPVFDMTTKTRSGQHKIDNRNDEIEHDVLKDAIERGFANFMNTREVRNLLKDHSQEELEKNFKPYPIPSSRKYVSKLSESVDASVTIKTKNGHGSGFVISSNGYIITNYHVVSDTTGLEVVLNNQKKYPVKVIRTSKVSDLALIKIDAKNLMAFKTSSNKNIEIASEIYAVGTPSAEDLSQTISKGIISAIRKSDSGNKLIQTDASVNGGNSGGAIIDKSGVVQGIVSSKLKGFGIEGVAFGIPSYELNESLKLDFK